MYLCVLVCCLLTASCGHTGSEVKFLRFEHFLAGNTEGGDATQFDSPLLNYNPDDPQFAAALGDFLSDPVVQDIFRVTDSLYHDLGWLEIQLGKALKRAERLCPSLHYDRFYTLVTADFADYQNRVFCSDHELAVSIDRYAVGALGHYNYFGMPSYLVALSGKEHIAPDCMASIARAHIELPNGQLSLLDYMVAEGKVQYFLEHTLPSVHDTLRLRYSASQLAWMEKNRAHVWASLIENRMLYCTDLSQLRNLIDDAPKTNVFGEGSAPRTPAYLGWQIVRQYMKRTSCTMEQLFADTDSQKILTESGWRP